MENITTLKWRPIYIAYGLAGLSAIMLFFTGIYSAAFTGWLKNNWSDDIIAGLSLQKVILLVLDMSLIFIAYVPLEHEDERIEKIRNFALKNAFLFGIATAVYMGFVLAQNFSMLIHAAFILVYYIVLFRLCIYRDPVFVYMSEEEMKVYVKKTMKNSNIFLSILLFLGAIIGNILSDIYHNHELFWYANLASLYILVLVRTVYYSWKG